MFLQIHLLIFLALTVHYGNGKQASKNSDDSCSSTPAIDILKTSYYIDMIEDVISYAQKVKDHYEKTGSKDQCSGEFYLEREISVMTEGGVNIKHEDLHAQTIKLKAGSWCVTMAYDDSLGPRLLAVMWAEYRHKVAYTVLRSRDKNSCPSSSGWLNVNVEALTPFTVHMTFVPGLNVGKKQVVIEPCLCENEHVRLKLDGSHVDHLLTCTVEGSDKTQCHWSRRMYEKDRPGAGEARWSTREDLIPGPNDDFVDDEEQERFMNAWPWVQEGGPYVVGQYFLASDWVGVVAEPGCFRFWLYAWGSIPHGILIRIQKRHTSEWETKAIELLPPSGHLVTWKEVHVPVNYEEFRIIVEFRGLQWTGNLIVDDISEDGVECSGKDPSKYIVPRS